MIILHNNSQGGIIRVCMRIFTTALRNKTIRQILNKNTSPYFHTVSLVIWPLSLMKRTHFSELSFSRFSMFIRKALLLCTLVSAENNISFYFFLRDGKIGRVWLCVFTFDVKLNNIIIVTRSAILRQNVSFRTCLTVFISKVSLRCASGLPKQSTFHLQILYIREFLKLKTLKYVKLENVVFGSKRFYPKHLRSFLPSHAGSGESTKEV